MPQPLTGAGLSTSVKVLMMCITWLPAMKLRAQLPATTSAHWVVFTDKDSSGFDPFAYFDPHAIERRTRQQLPLYDFRDLPVREDYCRQVAALADSFDNASRWLNAAVVYATDEQMTQIGLLPFVATTRHVHELACTQIDTTADADFTEFYDLLHGQTARMHGRMFRDSGFTGRGVRIAVFDVGFPNVDEHPAFEHIRQRHGIIHTYDFSRKSENVYRGVSHGTRVLSCIAGMYDSIPMGLATDAEFLLARTERILTEWTAEEHRWVFAAEWADKHGADIISSSLGYTSQRYTRQDMDGRTAPISIAAGIAASKGILVVNSAGNDGDSPWRTVGAPADADSVLAIGGTDPYTDMAITFTSFGPTADLRLKPNLCAFGQAITSGRQRPGVDFGTSFACPLVAGFAACAWQARPGLTNMELFRALEASAHLAPHYDYAHGYGIPQADRYLGTAHAVDTTFRFEIDSNAVTVRLLCDDFAPDLEDVFEEHIGFEGDRNPRHYAMPKGTRQTNLYYHVRDSRGVLLRFGVILPYSKVPLILWRHSDYKAGQTISVHYEGFTDAITIK